MIIAISSTDGKFNTEFSPRFGRCNFFIIVDTDTREWESKPNPALNARGGAGPQAVQFLSGAGVEATITGRYGPNAYTTLEAAGIRAYVAEAGTPEELLDAFLSGTLEEVSSATGEELHH
ncbi:MAG: dinitrogenase iron-molybdenum cofactor biosynthesis protein [Chloroflexota bacterium]|nr:MAG: dinitrogenase iron-molybdenum cofactor biosynthesis protein [Chloroflexota bacterium]